MTNIQKLTTYLNVVREDLDRTIEFWLSNSHDDEYGGFFNCLSTEGKVYDTLKYGWLQCRQVWTYAKLFNEIERFKRQDVLSAAIRGAEFLVNHLKDKASSKCFFVVTQQGEPVKQQRTLFTECFYAMALSELARATNDHRYRDEAISMYEKLQNWMLVDDSELGRPKYEGTPSTSSLAVPMMALCIIDQILTMDPEMEENVTKLLDWSVHEIKKHVQRDGTVVLENVSSNGQELPGSQGRLTIPGHIIECGWFLLKISRLKKYSHLKTLALDTFILKPFEYGWDNKHKGLFYFLDVDGWSPTQLEWNMKLWWPHNEAMISFLMAYEDTRNPMFLDKFEDVFNYSYSHFVDKENGEWFGYLNQEGNVTMQIKGGPFKGCFHVPRALLLCEQILKRIIENS